jgi:hypothetical protein
MTNGKILNGLNELIILMAKAKIDPELIVNENIKSKLISYINKELNEQPNNDINNNDNDNNDDNGDNSNNNNNEETINNDEDISDSPLVHEKFKDSSTNTETKLSSDASTQESIVNKDKATSTGKDNKRKMKTDQNLDKAMGHGSSREKYSKFDDTPTDILNSELWDKIESTPEKKPWDVALPEEEDTDW